jgi:hypothetical protein
MVETFREIFRLGEHIPFRENFRCREKRKNFAQNTMMNILVSTPRSDKKNIRIHITGEEYTTSTYLKRQSHEQVCEIMT